ncbi:hypothetical protein RhiJN_01891 [Ceratobasidium sp. AG-Ba]|nr:hypothetical protein RhiJN_01891 [Ceratobasidium sp. AG-Ba]
MIIDSYLFTYHLSYDGSFQLYRKNKTYDKWDICLSNGRKYFVQEDGFKKYLAGIGKDNAAGTTKVVVLYQAVLCIKANCTQDADCNNHKASKQLYSKFTGLDETGIGSVICARHSFFMPVGTVNFYTGESYAHTDFAVAGVLLMLLMEETTRVGLHYDIMCHYFVNMWKRWAALVAPLQPLSEGLFQEFIKAIPKFHLAGHTEQCFARFSLNFIQGVGRLDAEGGERCWSNLNHAAGSTSEKGPGARKEAICQCMQQSNWVKHVEMPEFLAQKHTEALSMALIQYTEWQEFNKTVGVERSSQWALESLDPVYKKGKWTSPFILPDPPSLSLATVLSQLESQEGAEENQALPGCAAWIADSIDLSVFQDKLRRDIAQIGQTPSVRQSQDIEKRRSSLLQQLEKHRTGAAMYHPAGLVNTLGCEREEHDGEPELMRTFLPSDIAHLSAGQQQLSVVSNWERQLQRAACLKALQVVHSISIQRGHIKKNQRKAAHGVGARTRAEAQDEKLKSRLEHAHWRYSDSYNRLVQLLSDPSEYAALQPLSTRGIDEIFEDTSKATKLGEGFIRMPWYWHVSLPDINTAKSAVTLKTSKVLKEYEASLKVEWFRARERYKQWDEEARWIERESASLVLFLRSTGLRWLTKAQSSSGGWSAAEMAEVEGIVDEKMIKKGQRKQRCYLTKFVGYSPEWNEWLSRQQLANAPRILKEWELKQRIQAPKKA